MAPSQGAQGRSSWRSGSLAGTDARAPCRDRTNSRTSTVAQARQRMIYVMRDRKTGLLKFGMSRDSWNAMRRIGSIRSSEYRLSGRSLDPELIKWAPWPYSEEGCIHRYLWASWRFGEWFDPTPDACSVRDLLIANNWFGWRDAYRARMTLPDAMPAHLNPRNIEITMRRWQKGARY